MAAAPLAGFPGYESRTFTYKTQRELQLSLDVLYPSTKPSSAVPVLIHYHGGFLILGDRYSLVPYWLVNACVERGWIFVTPDYRLIPETTAHDSVQDAVDAYQWVLHSLPKHLDIATGPVTLAGSSAGGYLALTTASLAEPRPAAVLSIYGMLNPLDQRYLTKGSNIFNLPAIDTAPVLEQLKALKQSKPQVLGGYSWPADPSQDPRFAMVVTFHIDALFPDFMSGVQGLSDAVAAQGVEAVPASERHLFPVTFGGFPKYPPTILFHGKNDSAVPCHLSQTASEKLRAHGVQVYTEFPEDAEHGFDARAGRVNIEKDESDTLKGAGFDGLRNVLKTLEQVVAAAKEH